MTTQQQLPTDKCFFRPDGTCWRRIEYTGADKEPRVRYRPVNLNNPEDARVKREDYFHPTLGWLVEGAALEREYDTAEVMADGSTSMMVNPDQTSQAVVSNSVARPEGD